MLKYGMSESSVSVQEPRPRKHSFKGPQMGFEISSQGDFTVPSTIIETSSAPSTFERVSNRLQWQEAKLGDNCVFFELGEKTLGEGEKPVGTLFNGKTWQTSGIASLESSFQQTEDKLTKFDAVVVYVNDFSKNHDQLAELLRKTRSRMEYKKSLYISVAKQDLEVEKLKLELSKMIQDAHFIVPKIFDGKKEKNEDILFETRTKVRSSSTIPHAKDKSTEAKRLANRTPGEIKRESFAMAIHKPDTPIPNGEKCFHCKGPLYFMSHAKPDEENGGYVNVMYRWCMTDGKRGKEIPLKKG
jgi:hypothetical protein